MKKQQSWKAPVVLILAAVLFLITTTATHAVANFSVNITEVRTTPNNVSQGQTGIIVDVKIANTGALGTDSENVNITNISLILHNGSLYTFPNNVTSNYTISLQNTTPIIINGTQVGGNTTYVRFLVNISRDAVNQTIIINATVNATNSSFGALASGAFTYAAVARFGDSWVVQTPASLNITNISASPFILGGTNYVDVSLNVTNVGEATAEVSAGSNVSNGSAQVSRTLIFLNSSNSTYAAQLTGFSVARQDSVVTIDGGASATLQFRVRKGIETNETNVTVNATLLFNDTNTGLVTPNGANKSLRDSTFQTDFTAPIINSGNLISPTTDKSKATFKFTTNTAATCRYSVDVNMDFGQMTKFDTTGDLTQNTIATLGNGVHRLYIRCRDAVSNDNEALSVSAFFNIIIGGGSGGAGDGGSSVKVASATGGQDTTVTFDQAAATGVAAITITPTKEVSNIRITVNKLFVPPAAPALSEEQGHVYKYLLINKVNLQDSDIQSAKIRFQVEKKWLSDRGISQDTVAMRRLEAEGWKELPTRMVEETEEMVMYEATTPGFSTFAITAGYKELSAPEPEVNLAPAAPAPVIPQPQPRAASEPAQPAPPATGKVVGEQETTQPSSAKPPSKGAGGVLLYLGLLVIVVIVIYYVYHASQRRKPF